MNCAVKTLTNKAVGCPNSGQGTTILYFERHKTPLPEVQWSEFLATDSEVRV
jgi:hypothetical protein